MNKDVIIIYESIYHGNTIKIAKAMAQKLNCKVITAEEAEKTNLAEYKIIGLGSGIYFTSHHPKLINLAESINSQQKAFIFSTHGAPVLGKYHQKLKSVLKDRRVELLGEFSCKGYDGTGPFIIIGGGNKGKPNEKDERKAMKFVSKILPEYCKNTNTVKKGKFVEVRAEECIGCGKCVNICPMGVFKIENKGSVPIKNEECIHCLLCVDNCPCQAIAVQHSWGEAIHIAKRHAKKTSL